jgi:heme exporter protein D
MNWGSLANFLEMGGYAGYVWGAYGATLVFVAAEIVALRARRRRTLQAVAQQARSGVQG